MLRLLNKQLGWSQFHSFVVFSSCLFVSLRNTFVQQVQQNNFLSHDMFMPVCHFFICHCVICTKLLGPKFYGSSNSYDETHVDMSGLFKHNIRVRLICFCLVCFSGCFCPSLVIDLSPYCLTLKQRTVHFWCWREDDIVYDMGCQAVHFILNRTDLLSASDPNARPSSTQFFHDGILLWRHSQPPPTPSLKLWKNWHLVKSHAHEHLQLSRNITSLQFKTTCACIFQYFFNHCVNTRVPFFRPVCFLKLEKSFYQSITKNTCIAQGCLA